MINGVSDFENYVLGLERKGKRDNLLLESGNDSVNFSRYIRSII